MHSVRFSESIRLNQMRFAAVLQVPHLVFIFFIRHSRQKSPVLRSHCGSSCAIFSFSAPRRHASVNSSALTLSVPGGRVSTASAPEMSRLIVMPSLTVSRYAFPKRMKRASSGAAPSLFFASIRFRQRKIQSRFDATNSDISDSGAEKGALTATLPSP